MERRFDCFLSGFTPDVNGQIIAGDVHLVLKGKPYLISVGTEEYVTQLRRDNEGKSPEDQLNDRVLILGQEEIVEPRICERLSKLPFEALEPYLVEQKPFIESS